MRCVRARIWGGESLERGQEPYDFGSLQPQLFFILWRRRSELEESAETEDTLPRVFPPSGRHSYSGPNSTIVVVVVVRPSDPVLFFFFGKATEPRPMVLRLFLRGAKKAERRRRKVTSRKGVLNTKGEGNRIRKKNYDIAQFSSG